MTHRRWAAKTAKLFRKGQSQAVRLPKEFRFRGTRVFVKKTGNTVLLIPVQDSWQTLFDSLSQFSEDFLVSRDEPEGQLQED